MSSDGNLFIQVGSFNTNLQAVLALPQDLVDWLAPTLKISPNLNQAQPRAPDIVVIGFQEILPLHLALAGFSNALINDRDVHIRSQIEKHAPGKESYTLLAKVVNVGVVLLVYAKDDGVARQVRDVQTQWTGTGPAYMGNKGAVGIRFRVSDRGCKAGEVFTFVCAHLTAHEPNLAQRVADYHHIVSTLLFPALPSSLSSSPTTMYSTSHLFFLGDLNFRITMPTSHPTLQTSNPHEVLAMLDDQASRERLKEFDQLLNQRRKGTAFVGLREGPFWTFKCTYKYKLGEVDQYHTKRTPSWTDRILYATHTDSPDTPEKSDITNILYTSIPSYVTSDHKPIVSLLLLPPPPPLSSPETCTPPMLRLSSAYIPMPDPRSMLKRYTGRTLDRIIGYTWCLLTLVGAGSAIVGIFNFFLGLTAWMWWKAPVVSLSDT